MARPRPGKQRSLVLVPLSPSARRLRPAPLREVQRQVDLEQIGFVSGLESPSESVLRRKRVVQTALVCADVLALLWGVGLLQILTGGGVATLALFVAIPALVIAGKLAGSYDRDLD